MPERITTAEAARRLGVHPVTVRRMVAAGRLAAAVERRPQGQRLVVLWEPPAHAPSGGAPHGARTEQEGASAPSHGADAPSHATATAPDQGALIAWLQARLTRAEEAQAELRRLLLMEQQTVAALRALLPSPGGPAGAAEGACTEQDGAAVPSATVHPHPHPPLPHVPWWRRLFRVPAGA